MFVLRLRLKNAKMRDTPPLFYKSPVFNSAKKLQNAQPRFAVGKVAKFKRFFGKVT